MKLVFKEGHRVERINEIVRLASQVNCYDIDYISLTQNEFIQLKLYHNSIVSKPITDNSRNITFNGIAIKVEG